MVRFILLLLGLTVFAEVGRSQSSSPNKEPERVKPVVNVQDQPGTPLKIAQVETKWATPDQQVLEIYVRVENVSDLEIRTYVWRMDKADGSQDKDGCFTHTIQSPDKILKPGDSDGKSTWRRFPVDGPTASINLSVDYVEFGNNTTWGLNVCHGAENLSALRTDIIRRVPLVTPTDRFVTNFNFTSEFAIKKKLEKCRRAKEPWSRVKPTRLQPQITLDFPRRLS